MTDPIKYIAFLIIIAGTGTKVFDYTLSLNQKNTKRNKLKLKPVL